MSQIVNSPTRKENILDLVFVNNSDLVLDSYVILTIYSDHRNVFVTLDTDTQLQNFDRNGLFKNDLSDVNLF